MKTEIWLPVEGYEGLYEVSDLGRVRSLNYRHTGETKILRTGMTRGGYLTVALCKDGKQKTVKVHRLVATAFVPNMFDDDCVNHINEDKTDNRADNLMWCDHSENNVWGSRIKRVSEKNTNGKLSKPLLQFTKSGEFIQEWPSASEVERVLEFYIQGISMCCRGERKSYKGFIWRYKTA